MSHFQVIRFAKESDVERILEIYAPFILKTPISFETVVPSLDEFRQRFVDIRKTHPWIVCEVSGKIAGYAYASPHRSRCSYSWSADVTVYVDSEFHRKKVGRKLYESLFKLLQHQGFYNAFAGITLPNPASEGLHKSLGFSQVGIYKNVGYKMDKWHDVVWYQLELQNGGVPKNPRPIEECLKQKVEVRSIKANDFEVKGLIESLDGYLESLYPPEENYLDPVEVLAEENCSMVGAYLGQILVGIGAIKFLGEYAELKRMYVDPLFRGLGISKVIISSLENLATSKAIKRVRLETGQLQIPAVKLYEKSGYKYISPFGDYVENNSSVFMERVLENARTEVSS